MNSQSGLHPHFDKSGLLYFHGRIDESEVYLEYGCGGSTVAACSSLKVRSVLSVDTSLDWISRTREQIGDNHSKLHLEHIDLGEVGAWGTPKGIDRYRDFWRYPTTPWDRAVELNLTPDTVLIDGRFRIACFLYSLICSRVGTTILFDDYFDRPHYFICEKFCRVDQRHGRLAVFTVAHNFSVSALTACFCKHSLDWS